MTLFLAHVGHDHGAHHWAPMVLLSLVLVTVAVLVARRAREERR